MFKTLYHIFLDALFPVSSAEHELFSMSPAEALERLTPAPDYSGLAVPLPGAHSVFAYKDERVSKLVWNIKYKKSPRAVNIGGYALFRYLIETCVAPDGKSIPQDTPSASADAAARSRPPSRPPKGPAGLLSAGATHDKVLILPIPITLQRRRERGYNQCELLIDEMMRLATEGTTEARDHYIFEKDLLIRTQHASRQTLKDRRDRQESAKGIFGIDEKKFRTHDLTTPVIVIDDVITTGSTMHEAIETLRKAGFGDVRALSLAH